MSLECGIVGLPNVGKSTLFNALTSAENAAAENYPFCTIDPNVGMVEVPDVRIEEITKLIQPKKKIPTTVSFVDIAGLVKGASKGEGLGNQFLGNIKNCDAIAQVVRCFDDGDVVHVHGNVDPIRDIEIIETELMLADLGTVVKRVEKNAKLARSGDAKAKELATFLEVLQKSLEEGKAVRTVSAEAEQWALVHDLHLITQKPMLYVANLDENSIVDLKNEHFETLKKYAEENGAGVIPISAKIEAELVGMSEEEKVEFLSELGIQEPGLNVLIKAAYDLLGLKTYFTAGEQEVRAWTIRQGWKAPKAAGVIHGDFERGFICAEAYHFKDLMEHKSEQKVKEAGLMRTEGKEYVVQDGDILHFRFNV